MRLGGAQGDIPGGAEPGADMELWAGAQDGIPEARARQGRVRGMTCRGAQGEGRGAARGPGVRIGAPGAR